jgi:hypothetical protein
MFTNKLKRHLRSSAKTSENNSSSSSNEDAPKNSTMHASWTGGKA